MTYTLFFIPDYHFQKVFLCFPIGNFLNTFCGGPLVVDAPGQLPSLPPPIKSGSDAFTDRVRQRHDLIGCSETLATRN